jgi:predicted DNA binding protein
MVKFVELFTKITKVQIQQAAFPEHSVVSHLTEKQREVITAARKYGYFEYPRKISASQLAERLGLSKTTTIEHLRKAENYILSRILVD